MDPSRLPQRPQTGNTSPEIVQATTTTEEAAPGGADFQAAMGFAIANLTAELHRVTSDALPAAHSPLQQVAPSVDVPTKVDTVVKQVHVAPRSVAEDREKCIAVPVRQRNGPSRPVDSSLKAFTLELPATPFHPRAGPSDAPYSALAQPQPTPGGGMPADTPMAAEVLASLCALGIQFGPPPPQNQTQPARAPTARPQRQPNPTVLGRRAATSRAAEMAVAAATYAPPRRVVKKNENFGANVIFGGGADGARKGCNCKRSQCLKLYCECFAAGGFCIPGCQCANCRNTEIEVATVEATRATILSKNPAAFKDKVVGDTHKKGCRCKRSKCLKKYCECYNAGVKCNPEICQCNGCHNKDVYGGPAEDDYPDEPLAVENNGGNDRLAEDNYDLFASSPEAPFAKQAAAVIAIAGDENITSNLPSPTEAVAAVTTTVTTTATAAVLAPHPQTLPWDSASVALATAIAATTTGRRASHDTTNTTTTTNPASGSDLMPPPPANSNLPPPRPSRGPAVKTDHQLDYIYSALAPATAAEEEENREAQQQLDVLSGDDDAVAVARAAATEEDTPGGGALRAPGPSALTAHLSGMVSCGGGEIEMLIDTATSPGSTLPGSAGSVAAATSAAAAAAKMASQNGRRLAAVTMTGAAKAASGAAARTKATPSGTTTTSTGPVPMCSDADGSAATGSGGSGSGLRGKRPRRAASGGVCGAVAAATSDWGVDIISPPPKRSYSVSDAAGVNGGHGGGAAAAAARRDRTGLLKKALHNDAAAATQNAGREEEDAISALVSMNR